jgi:hypothetical protein
MKKIALLLPILAIILSMVGTSSAALADTASSSSSNMVMMTDTATGKTVEVDVMTHICNPNVKNVDDFNALAQGKDVLAGFANQVLNCPTTVLPAHAPVVGTVAAPQTPYDFSVTGEHNPTQTLKDAAFHAEKLCETDINKDVNGDGKIASSTCLDTSEYHFNTVMAENGKIEVKEMTPPQGFHFGTFLFTPTIIDQNNDQQSLLSVDPAQGRIQLDASHDTDKIITLHIYNFANSDNPTGTTTTSTSTVITNNNDRTSIINQIHDLQAQIQHLFAEIQNLLARL